MDTQVISILGIAVLLSYYIVFNSNSESYFDSKYWLGIPDNVKTGIIIFQIIAGISYMIWIYLMFTYPPKTGILSYDILGTKGLTILISLFLISSMLWPFTLQYINFDNLSVQQALITNSTIWVASFAASLLLAGTFEDMSGLNNPNFENNSMINYIKFITILFFCIVVILLDGIGWSSILLYKSIYQKK